ncbi:MAG: MFS transporter [Bryobacteraceae bacterium]|nr:MFS transporter [Bryobacteraceae bacterium]
MNVADGAAMQVARRGLSALFFSGLLTALLGAVLPVWRYHLEPDYIQIGNYFLLQNLGILAGAAWGAKLLGRRSIGHVLALGCGIACAALLVLAAFCPPASVWGRLAGLLLTGAAAGVINQGGMHAIAPAYELHRTATLNLSGILFGAGCLVCALFVSGTFFVYTAPSLLVLLAALPGLAAGVYARMPSAPEVLLPERGWREALEEFKTPAAILFAALLFFQSGNEGALAGWLALFLTQRLGTSPATSLSLLALYWAALLLGRVAAQWALTRVPHGRMLAGAVAAQIFGCTALFFTDNLFGATVGVLLAGGGFSVILPLVLEKIGDRFPRYHPALFNGIFSVALTGGLLAPASLGYLAHFAGVGVVMGLPVLGAMMVVLLSLAIWLEAKLSAA